MGRCKLIVKSNRGKQKGAAMIIALIFVMVFSALAVSLASMSSSNMQLANNTRKGARALEAAHSGLDIIRQHLSNISFAENISPPNRLAAVAAKWQIRLSTAGITNVYPLYSNSPAKITINDVTLSTTPAQSFSASLTYGADYDTVQLDITGQCSDVIRKVRVTFGFTEIGNAIFDFGVASKGPLALDGQSEISDVNISVAAGAYIEGDNLVGDSFSITNHASIAGDVSIANPSATFSFGSKASVGGATGDDIYDHITVGVDYVDFPTPYPDYFRTFATGEVIDGNTTLDNYEILNNCTIAPNTNPTFSSNMTINGILFIETPNVVHFAGQAIVNGIIAGDGSLDDPFSNNSLTFSGQVVCNDVATLEGEEFAAIKEETGTFIMAPGFSLDFSGQALNMSGAIAASGISFSGQAGGTIDGSLINYSDDAMTLTGQSSLLFNRSGRTSDPVGFLSDMVLMFDPASYSEPRL